MTGHSRASRPRIIMHLVSARQALTDPAGTLDVRTLSRCYLRALPGLSVARLLELRTGRSSTAVGAALDLALGGIAAVVVILVGYMRSGTPHGITG